MTEEQIHNLGICLRVFSEEFLNHRGDDVTGIGIPRMLMQNIEAFIGGKWVTSDEYKHLVEAANTNWYGIKEITKELDKLRKAIETHRAQKADDRCIEDDDKLYEVLGDGIKCDRRVGSKIEMLINCQRFIEKRCEGGGWPSYKELEDKLKLCQDTIENLLKYIPIGLEDIEDKVLVSQILECLETAKLSE